MEYSNTTNQYGYGNPPPYTVEVSTQPQSQAGQPEPPPGALIVQPRPTYIISQEHFKPYSTRCPNCRAQITTETTFQVGTLAKMWIFILCCSFVWFGLICPIFLPCCMKCFKDVTHVCPQCHGTVATYKRHEIHPQYQKPWFRSRHQY